jgi:uncharacterized membrane protein YjdF
VRVTANVGLEVVALAIGFAGSRDHHGHRRMTGDELQEHLRPGRYARYGGRTLPIQREWTPNHRQSAAKDKAKRRDTHMSVPEPQPGIAARIHRGFAFVVVVVMTIEAVLLWLDGEWLNALLVMMIMGVILTPTVLSEHLPVRIPAEFQLLALLFSFAALFLGEVRSYYTRIWWWDIALHASSGLLLGILGFLLVYVLNESRRVDIHMRPRFVALFAFLFAVAAGALWEIFEFTMDQLFGTNMQKPMLGDPSGLTDTMWDLIVDTIGAAIISFFGWWYMRRRRTSFIERWISKFVAGNPHLFRR